MQEQLLQTLFDQYINGKLSVEDTKILMQLLASGAHDAQWHGLVEKYYDELPVTHHLPAVQSENMLQEILLHQEGHVVRMEKAKLRPVRRWRYISAAAVLLLLVTSIVWWRSGQLHKEEQLVMRQALAPGSDRAILTLANGEQIVLDSAATGNVAQQGAVKIIKSESGKVIYALAGNQADGHEVQYNTLTTPRGAQFQIQLPDGSQVWLNAASTLRYPTAFINDKREVQLTGEGYFEIAENKAKPFFVQAGNTQVRVLGTGFNINAYEDEEAIKTTLVHGSVRVTGNNANALIKPGEQASLPGNDQQLVVSRPDLAEVLAWRQGEFIFKNANIKAIMRQIARWYDVEVVYAGNMPDVGLSGSMHRSEYASQLLEALELTKDVHFKIEGRKVIVMSGAR